MTTPIVRTSPDSRHTHELEALYKISRILAEASHQQQAFSDVLDTLHNDLGMSRGTIVLLSPDSDELSVEISHNLSDKQSSSLRYRVGEGITGRVVQSGKAMIVPRVSQEPLFLDRQGRQHLDKNEISFICVPISLGQKVVGALSVDRIFEEVISFEEDMRVLTIVAGLIAHDVRHRWEEQARRKELEDENLRLRHALEDRYRPENIIGNSHGMREVYQSIHQVAASDTTVLLRGESGTGKELVASAVHYSSPRAVRPFVKVNCAALPETLIESELFGHERGAFTGALEARRGHVEEAGDGTLFLDEIGDFSPAIQVRLLRVLQEREYKRLGSNKTLKTACRIICATNRDLEQAVRDGHFRQDLYYRINVFPIYLPPLRDRKDDILLLADHFVEKYAKRLDKPIRRISTPAINMMVSYHWPGNVRELENCIERAVLLAHEGVIQGHHLPPSLQTSDASDTIGVGTFAERVALYERDLIVDALKRQNGNVAAAARDIGATPRIVRYKVQQLDIEPSRFRRKRYPGS
jgi:Nif-specific regulatory protein